MIFVDKVKFDNFEDLKYYLIEEMSSGAAHNFAAWLLDTPEAESLTNHIYFFTSSGELIYKYDEEETQ